MFHYVAVGPSTRRHLLHKMGLNRFDGGLHVMALGTGHLLRLIGKTADNEPQEVRSKRCVRPPVHVQPGLPGSQQAQACGAVDIRCRSRRCGCDRLRHDCVDRIGPEIFVAHVGGGAAAQSPATGGWRPAFQLTLHGGTLCDNCLVRLNRYKAFAESLQNRRRDVHRQPYHRCRRIRRGAVRSAATQCRYGSVPNFALDLIDIGAEVNRRVLYIGHSSILWTK